MRRILFVVMVTLVAVAGASVKVVEAGSGLPLAAASVYSSSGAMVSLTESDGTFADQPESAYPLTVRCLGYEAKVADGKTDLIEMTPAAYHLPEVTVTAAEREIMALICYVREYTSVVGEGDTTVFFSEKMVDYLLPLKEKLKKFKGRTSARVLSARNYAMFRNDAMPDSFARNIDDQLLSWLILMDMDTTATREPESLRAAGSAASDSVMGKYSLRSLYAKTPATYSVTYYFLCDKKDRHWSPWFMKMLGCTIDFREIATKRLYTTNRAGVYAPQDLLCSTFTLTALASGKLVRKAYDSKTPVVLNSYIEVYPVGMEYMTALQAKELDRNPPRMEIVQAPAAAPLDASTLRLVNRASVK